MCDQVDVECIANLHWCKQIVSLINEIHEIIHCAAACFARSLARFIETSLIKIINIVNAQPGDCSFLFQSVWICKTKFNYLKKCNKEEIINYFINFSWFIATRKNGYVEKISQIWIWMCLCSCSCIEETERKRQWNKWFSWSGESMRNTLKSHRYCCCYLCDTWNEIPFRQFSIAACRAVDSILLRFHFWCNRMQFQWVTHLQFFKYMKVNFCSERKINLRNTSYKELSSLL